MTEALKEELKYAKERIQELSVVVNTIGESNNIPDELKRLRADAYLKKDHCRILCDKNDDLLEKNSLLENELYEERDRYLSERIKTSRLSREKRSLKKQLNSQDKEIAKLKEVIIHQASLLLESSK